MPQLTSTSSRAPPIKLHLIQKSTSCTINSINNRFRTCGSEKFDRRVLLRMRAARTQPRRSRSSTMAWSHPSQTRKGSMLTIIQRNKALPTLIGTWKTNFTSFRRKSSKSIGSRPWTRTSASLASRPLPEMKWRPEAVLTRITILSSHINNIWHKVRTSRITSSCWTQVDKLKPFHRIRWIERALVVSKLYCKPIKLSR